MKGLLFSLIAVLSVFGACFLGVWLGYLYINWKEDREFWRSVKAMRKRQDEIFYKIMTDVIIKYYTEYLKDRNNLKKE